MRKSRSICTAGVLSALVLAVSLTTVSPVASKGSEWDGQIEAGSQSLARGDYFQAAVDLESALKSTVKFQTNDPRLGRTYYELGELRAKQGDWNDAREYYKRALYIQQLSTPSDSASIGKTVYGLAVSCEQTRDYQEAVIHLKRVYDIWSRLYGPTDARLAEVLESMATYATLDSDLNTAEQCYRQLVDIQEKKGAKNPKLGAALNLWASSLANAGKWRDAEPIAKRAVDILSTGSDTPTSLDSAIATLRYVEQHTGAVRPYIPASVAESIDSHTGTLETPAVPPSRPDPETTIALNPTVKTPELPNSDIKALEAAQPIAQKNVDSRPSDEKWVGTAAAAKPSVGTEAAAKPSVGTSTAITPAAEISVATAQAPETPVSPVPITKTSDVSKATSSAEKVSTGIAIVDNAKQTKLVMRPPTKSAMTTSSEFRPWELHNMPHINDEPLAGTNKNWGKIRYLANGRLISPEQYKAMLLANEAYELIRAEKFLMSVDILQKALAIYPQMATGRSNLGLALSQLGRYDEAVENLREAISIDQSKPGAWLNLASSFQMSGQLREAIATYSEFARRFPNEQLASKATELVNHLTRELQEQESVARAGDKETGSDYFAYASHGAKLRWPESNATVKVFVSNGSGVSGFKSEYAGFFADSFKQWAAASKDKINFQIVKKPEDSNIECMWTDDISTVSCPAEGGETRLIHDGKNISHATINVLTSGTSPDSPLSPSQVRAICLHEIGHALGLVGHSPKPTDVMYCSVPPANAKVGISDRDTGTIIKLYSGDSVSFLRGDFQMVWCCPSPQI